MLVLGLDQGGSHTWAAAVNADGLVLGLGQAGGACHASDGMARAMAEAERAGRAALAAAGAQETDLLLAGMTGADWPDEYDMLARSLSGLGLAGRVVVTNDSLIALRGGTSRAYGVILIAGSGGNVAARSPAGEEFHFGYYHDPEYQGGGALARLAMTAIFRANSLRGGPTLLADLFCARLGFAGVDELARAYFDGRVEVDARLAPLVFEACGRGDPAAQQIVRAFALGYAEMARAVLRRFGMADLEVEVVLSGGVFKTSDRLLRETLLAEVQREAPLACLIEARYEPVVGAALLGLERLGIDTGAETFRRRLDESARALGLIRGVE